MGEVSGYPSLNFESPWVLGDLNLEKISIFSLPHLTSIPILKMYTQHLQI